MPADWSPPASAMWIGAPHPFDLHEAYLCFRSPPFAAGDEATLYLTADSRYRLWINGIFAARGPARCYPDHQAVDRIDLAPFLAPGDNRLAIHVYQPGYSHFAYVHRGVAGLLAAVTNGEETLLVSDGRWRACRDLSFPATVPRVSIYGSGVERRDLAAVDDWTNPAFDDGGWAPARLVAMPGDAPWTGLALRAVPFMRETLERPVLIERRRGPTRETAGDAHGSLTAGWQAARPIVAQKQADGITLEVVSGLADYFLFDLGRDFTCHGVLAVDGAAGGEIIRLSYAEKIRDGRLVLSDPATYCRMRLTDETILRPGSQTVEGFSLRGGRFILLQIVGFGPAMLRLGFAARLAEYPLEISRPPAPSDPELAPIATLCLDTLRACLQDSFVDCVWREGAQWLGDGLTQALALSAVSDDLRPVRRLLEMSAEGVYPDGMVPSVLPGEVHAYTISRYGCLWVELLAYYHQAAGDEPFLEQLWPVLEGLLDRLLSHRHPSGLVLTPPGRRLYVDWAPNAPGEPHAVINLHLIIALQIAAGLATGRDRARQAGGWQAEGKALRRLARRHFQNETGQWFDDCGQTVRSQLTHALAVLSGSAPAADHARLLDQIAARSLDPSDDPQPDGLVLASPFMHHYLFEALRQGGRDQEVLDIIKLRWGRWARAGYPTAWENWNVDFPDGSQCHGFAAHPLYHLRQIAQL